MNAIEFYAVTIVVFACAEAIAALGFNLQLGYAGIVNFGIMIQFAAGAYGTAIAAVSPATRGGYTTYIGGFAWGEPWAMLFGVACAVGVSLLLGFVALRRLRDDYLALTLVAILTGLQSFVAGDHGLFNGTFGIANIPGPLSDQLSIADYQWFMLVLSIVLLAGTYAFVARLTRAPLGRALRAIREDEQVAQSLGRNTWRLKMVAFVVGGACAGLGGSLVTVYVGFWSTGAWQTTEVLGILAGVIVGGRARNIGALIGTVLVTVVLVQGVSFLPQIGNVAIQAQLEIILQGVVIIAFLWFRPEGLFPERKDRFPVPVRQIDPQAVPDPGSGFENDVVAGRRAAG